MSLVFPTLSVACAIDDRQIVVSSATGISAGCKIRVDSEVMQVTKGYVAGSTTVPALRGQEGSVAQAHAITSTLAVGVASDFSNQTDPQQVVQYPIAGRSKVVKSYNADGALDLPSEGGDLEAILTKATAQAMTLAVPTKDLTGSRLSVIGQSGAAHTVTFASGIAGGALTVATFDSSNPCTLQLEAVNGLWVPCGSPFSGTLTSIDVALS